MRSLFIALGLLIIVLLPGCGGKEYTYVEDHELKPGPGLFSGEDGEFTLYKGATSKKENEEEAEKKSPE